MNGEPLPYVPPEPEESNTDIGPDWRVTSVKDMDFALLRIRELKAEIAAQEDVAQTRILEIQERAAHVTKRARWLVGFFESHIRAFAQQNRDALLGHGRKKSVDLIHGSVSFRKCGGGLAVTDREALTKWAEEQPVESGVLRVKTEVDVNAVKARFKELGEVPPGTDVEPEREEILVKPLAKETGNGN